eukprot:3937703-Rhodomonas_salina.1
MLGGEGAEFEAWGSSTKVRFWPGTERAYGALRCLVQRYASGPCAIPGTERAYCAVPCAAGADEIEAEVKVGYDPTL